MFADADARTKRWEFVIDEPTRILVVDDDPILREFASVHLATPCTTIDTACDGAAALVRLGQASYDVLLLDIEMPHLDGFTLLEEIRTNDRLSHLPVIMLTAHDDVASIDRAYQAGADAFATKPVNWRQLSYQIRYVVRAGRLERSKAEPSAKGGPDGEVNDAASTPENDVRVFLRKVLRRVLAIEARLPIDERPQYAYALQGIRLFAKQALAFFPDVPGSAGAASVAQIRPHPTMPDSATEQIRHGAPDAMAS